VRFLTERPWRFGLNRVPSPNTALQRTRSAPLRSPLSFGTLGGPQLRGEGLIRLTTWNMDHWRRSTELREEAWAFLAGVVRPDVALLQEALPARTGDNVVFREGGILDERKDPPRNLGWGSAVVSYGPPVRPREFATSPFHAHPVPLLRTFPGAVAVAELTGELPLVVISTYGVIDRGYADATVHRMLSDLTPLIDERRGRGIVLAGDLNITTQWSEKHRSFLRGRQEECLQRDTNLFDRFTALGLHNVVVRSERGPLEGCDCHAGVDCRHVQTQRHDRSAFPWQNDYIFVSDDLLQDVKVEVIDDDAAWRLSGHCPIVVQIGGT